MVSHFKSFLLTPWFLAALLAAIAIILLPDMFDKFRINIVEAGKHPFQSNYWVKYDDLDHDGNSEKVVIHYSTDSLSAIQVYLADGGILEQWNFRGKPYGAATNSFIADTDKDLLDEIYLFSIDGDTILFHGLNPFDTLAPIMFENKRLCILSRQYNAPDPEIVDVEVADLNGDGKGELIISVISSRAKAPRNIFVYDVHKGTLRSSETFGTCFNTIETADLDQDGILEIYGNTSAGGNVHDSLGYPYSDYSAWLYGLDSGLNTLFEPIEFPGFQSKVFVTPVTIKGLPLLAAFYNHTGSHENYPELMLMDTKGQIRKSYRFPLSSKIDRRLLVTYQDGKTVLNVITLDGYVIQFNEDLHLVDSLNLAFKNAVVFKQINLDNHPDPEIIFRNNEPMLCIATQEFKHPAKVIEIEKHLIGNISVIQKQNTPTRIYCSGDDRYLIIEYQKNPWYYAKYPIYLGIFLAFWLFILLIGKIQMIRLKKQELVKRQIMDLQLKAIKNQMDPHFTFNVFSTIAAMIQKESESIYQPFLKFTNLIRNTLESTDKIARPLSQEILFLQNYLDLEILRNPDIFDYSIDVADEVEHGMKVPKMLLQIYVENAIKHGLRHKQEKGTLSITIQKVENHVKIEVTDNGIGRAKAKEISTGSTGFGLQIMEDYFKLFNEYNTSKIQQEIIDLFDDQNNPSGTKINILIPLNFSYKFSSHGI